MIDQKKAVEIAKSKASEILNQSSFNLEEIERDEYAGRDVWSITLSFPRNVASAVYALQLTDPFQYKRFLIDSETGDMLAMKIREVASQ